MVKPADSMEWASDGAAQIAEPLEAKKDIGWIVGEKPPAQYFNWWMKNAYLWQQYFEVTTDALLTGSNVLTSTTDITLTVDSDNNSTANFVVINHNGTGAELFKFDESANLRVNVATVGTSGAGVVALKNGTAPSTNVADVVQLYPADFAGGDSRLYIRSESGGPISIGNDAIRSVNSDGTFIFASEKHVTIDIDSDNDGTDGIFKVRANGTTDALTVSEAGVVTATGAITGTNVGSTNLTDLTNLYNTHILNSLSFTDFTAAAGPAADNMMNGRCVIGNKAISSSGFALLDASDGIVNSAHNNLNPTQINGVQAGFFQDIAKDSTYGVACGNAGIIYTALLTSLNSWTSRTSGTANGLGFVAGNNTWWVAAGNGANNTLRYNDSNPADAWSASTSGLDGTTIFRGVATDGTKFTAITQDNEVIYTTNPSTGWTLQGTVAGLGAMTYMDYIGGKWVAYDSGSTTYFYSNDGLSWSSTTVGASLTGISHMYAIPINNGQYLWMAIQGSGGAFAWSNNHASITNSGFDLASSIYTATTAISNMCYSEANGRFFGYTSGLAYSLRATII